MTSKKASGFTLIELMIVVAIIGILAAIAIPNFLRYQLRAKFGELKSNVEGIFKSEESLKQNERQLCLGSATGQYVAFLNAIPAGQCAAIPAGGATSKGNWVAADLQVAQGIDWQVQGSTFGCYNAAVTASGAAACANYGGFGLAFSAGASSDIDGDKEISDVCLWQPQFKPDGTVSTAPPGCPAIGAHWELAAQAYAQDAQHPAGQVVQCSADSVF